MRSIVLRSSPGKAMGGGMGGLYSASIKQSRYGVYLFLMCTYSCSTDWTFLIAINKQPSCPRGVVYMYVYAFVCTCVCVSLFYVYMYVHVYVYVYVYLYVHVCVYVYVNVFVFLHVHA